MIPAVSALGWTCNVAVPSCATPPAPSSNETVNVAVPAEAGVNTRARASACNAATVPCAVYVPVAGSVDPSTPRRLPIPGAACTRNVSTWPASGSASTSPAKGKAASVVVADCPAEAPPIVGGVSAPLAATCVAAAAVPPAPSDTCTLSVVVRTAP